MIRLAPLVVASSLVGAGCSSTPPHPQTTSESLKASRSSAPRVVRCTEASACFDTAKALCQGSYHQIAEPRMAFPAIVNDDHGGYRVLVTCQRDGVR